MTTIGIDNGATGSIGIISPDGALFEATPTRDCLHYGKAGTLSKAIDRLALRELLGPHISPKTRVYIERPFTGSSMMIKAMLLARQTFAETVCTLEDLGLGYEVIDSREWQKPLLGKVKGSSELKLASKLRATQLYPHLKAAIEDQGDGDGLLIAHAAHYSLLARA